LRRRGLLLVALALLAGCGGESEDAPTSQDLSNPEAMMLRLADLPRGFRQGDDTGCGQFASTEGTSPELDEFLSEALPRGCSAEFVRAWGDGPVSVQGAVLVFATPDDARRAWDVRGELFRRLEGVFISEESETDAPGDDAARFDSEGLNEPGAGVVWRDGRLLAVVYEEGLIGEEGRRFAADLARKQDQRIRSPEPVADAEGGREVGLDDPSIAVPVYWLGREFEPDGFPRLELFEGVHLKGRDGPGNEVKIDYSGGAATAIHLDLWKPHAWEKFRTTRLGRMVWDSPCSRRSDLRVDGGRATIYGGYGSGGCPQSEPDHWLAHVYLDGVVLAVNMAYCYACGGRPADDPYNSRLGMEAIVRGLQRR
jgi:hypothetical protein